MDAAAPGDTLLVLPGSHSPFAVDKPLSILGDGSQTVFVTAPTSDLVCSVSAGSLALEVSGLAATEEVFLSGMTIQTTAVGITSQCEMADQIQGSTGLLGLTSEALVVEDSSVWVMNSSLYLARSTVLGGRGSQFFGSCILAQASL